MPIADDWDFDYANKILQHIDGVLSYDTGSGTQPAVGNYVYGVTSGAIGKVIARTGTVTSGTLTLTNVEGLFEDNEQVDIASEVNFDAVTAGNGGFEVGDTIVDQVTGSIDVLAIEYNSDGLGGGTIYGNSFAAFTNNSQLDISGGQADVADADGTGTNNDSALTAQVAGTLAVPGTNNSSEIIHYDAGTVAIPEQAILEGATSTATGLVEQVTGVLGTGSVRLVDVNGTFTDDETLRVDQVIAYQNQVAGEVFSVGDVVVGGTSGATGRVLADTGTQLILADESGTWTTTEDLNVGGTKIAEANGTNTTLNVATCNIADGIRTEQVPNSTTTGASGQGGIYAAATSLNIVRKLNSLYTLSQDTFDELLQLDDDEAMDASVKGGAYQLVFNWFMPELSARFLRQGGLTDTTNANIWANPQTVGAQNKITDTAFFYDASQPYRMPQLYIEQDQRKIPCSWLEGDIDVLVKVKTRNDTRYIAPATPALGQLIPGGDPQVDGAYTVLNREFHVSTFDATQFNAAAGGVNTVALGTSDETVNNPNGTHTAAFSAGGAGAYTVGETITTGSGNSRKVGVVVSSDSGATGNVEYVLKSGTNFANTDVVVGEVSAKSATFAAPTNVVAGYGDDIRWSVVEETISGGTGGSVDANFNVGDLVTQAVTGATGYVVYADTTGTGVLYIEKANATAFSGDNNVTGANGGTLTAGTGATYNTNVTSFTADLNNGEGAQTYTGAVSGDLTGGGADTIQNVFQYGKYLSRHEEETWFFEGPGGTADLGTVGRFFRKLKDAYSEVKPGAPIGTYTGSLAFGQGWFLDTNFIAAADIRSFSVIDDGGVTRNPPNLQSLTITGVSTGWRVAAYRDTGLGNGAILRSEFDVGVVGSGNNQAADSTILVGANTRTVGPLPADVPDTGVLYVLDPNDTGLYLQFPYSSVNRTTNIFTLASGTIGDVTGAVDLTLDDNVHVAFIRETASGTSVTNTMQYVANIPIFFVARKKGFKPFRSTTEFTSTGGSGGVVQNADSIVDLP
jgi:hypothetical protein